MKLVRFGRPGKERPGLIDDEGKIRDLTDIVPDICAENLSARTLAKLRKIKPRSLPLANSRSRIGPCVVGVHNFVAVGLNYADHAAETGAAIPREPILFNKSPSSIIGPNDNVVIPKGSKKTDWEVELAVVIGTAGHNIPESQSLAHVAGYCICNDVSERAWQVEGTGQWVKGKSAPTFGPLGPWLVTTDEIPDPQNLSMFLDVNGKRRQTGSTKTMIFGVKHLVSFISKFMALEPGDVITTGTPPGVGLGMKPPLFLKAGDVMHLGIEKLGAQTQHCVAYSG
jgi:2,4-didehydro-3-deoxy-L-rhamnonate hydrolase